VGALVCAALACAPAAARAKPRVDDKALVEAHNRARAKHCAPPLAWSKEVAASAQRWADTLRARGCGLGHSGGRYGENLAAGTAGTIDEGAAVALWYAEGQRYPFPRGGFSMKTGHFSQLVWRATTRLGCGRTECNGLEIWVCQYDPPGNVEGEYRENVLPASCRK
jgi:hypothetical protein